MRQEAWSRRNINTSFPNRCSGIFLVESIEGWSKKQDKTSKQTSDHQTNRVDDRSEAVTGVTGGTTRRAWRRHTFTKSEGLSTDVNECWPYYHGHCLVPRPHYYARPMHFGSRGPRQFLRPRQTRRSETFCLTGGGAFGSGRAVNNFSAMMKDVQQPWRVQRINRAFLFYARFHCWKSFGLSYSFISLN